MKVKNTAIKDITPYERNPRINNAAVAPVKRSIQEFGFQQPIVTDKGGIIIVGHTRYLAALELGLTHVPVVIADLHPDKAKAYRIADNQTGNIAEWDKDLLQIELTELHGLDFDMDLLGFGAEELADLMNLDLPYMGGTGTGSAAETQSLADRFLIPPFSVLDARQGYWQERKRAWLALGIQSELGRGGAPGGSPRPAARLTESGHTMRGDGAGRPIA